MGITSLPAELVLHLFELAVGQRLRKRDAIWLSHINHGWRAMAIATPSLWTNLDFRLGAACAREFGRRSQDLSLDVYVCQHGVLEPDLSLPASTSAALADFMAAALDHADHWVKFTADLTVPAALDIVMGAAHKALSGTQPRVLDMVVLHVSPSMARNPSLQLYSQLPYAPFVPRSLTLEAVPAWEPALFTAELLELGLWNFTNALLPRHQLEGLSMSGVTFDLAQLTRALSLTPNLRTLVLLNAAPPSLGVDPIKITLRSLTSLTIRGTAASIVAQLFSYVQMPALRTLDLSIVGPPLAISVALRALSYKTILQELRLELVNDIFSWITSAREAQHAALLFPSLECLALTNTSIDDVTLRSLVASRRLRQLRMREEHTVSFVGMMKFLLARRARYDVAALDYLNVDACVQLRGKHREELGALVCALDLSSSELRYDAWRSGHGIPDSP